MNDFIDSSDIERAFRKDFQALVDKYAAMVRIGYNSCAYEVEIPPIYEGRKKVREGCCFDLDTCYVPIK